MGAARDGRDAGEPVHFAEKDRPLRRDVGRLGALLGELLRELAPVGVYETVEAARLATRRRRKGPERPTVAEEVEHVLFFLPDVLYRIVPSLHEELERALELAYDQPVPVEGPLVRFASWVGGDMDGNPNIGADTIRATLARHHQLVLRPSAPSSACAGSQRARSR